MATKQHTSYNLHNSGLYRTNKISFQAFKQKEVIHLKALYPFLTKAQINSKVRDLWKNMSVHEKQNFSKVVLTRTPTKSPKVAKKKEICVKNSSEKNKIKSSRWKDFHAKSETMTYKSDFSPEIKVKKHRSSPSWLMESPAIPVTKDYSKTRTQHDIVPEIIDETPSKQVSILKPTTYPECQNKETASTNKKKNRVSFSPPAVTANNAQNLEVSRSSSTNSSPGYSSEEDCTLIRRSSKDVCDFEDIENFSMYIEEADPFACERRLKVNAQINDRNINYKEESMRAENENTLQFEESKDEKTRRDGKETLVPETKQTFDKLSHKKPNGKKKTTPEVSRRKTRAQDVKSGICATDVAQDTELYATPLMANSDTHASRNSNKTDTEQYTTPMMDDATMKLLVEQAKHAPKKRTTRGGSKHNKIQIHENGEFDATTGLKKQKARTSLIGKNSVNKENVSIIDASGDAKICVSFNKNFNAEIEKSDENLKKDIDVVSYGELPAMVDYDGGQQIQSTFEIPEYPTIGPYFSVPDNVPQIELTESDSDGDSVLEACKLTSNQTLLETLRRMKEVTCIQLSPRRSPTTSPKILSPALSGISQLSSASSESKSSMSGSRYLEQTMDENQKQNGEANQNRSTDNGNTASSTKENDQNLDHECQPSNIPETFIESEKENLSVQNDPMSELQNEFISDVCAREQDKLDVSNNGNVQNKPPRTKKITRFAKRKGPLYTNQIEIADKALCELFYDLTPPEKKKNKASSRRLLASAVTPGKSNFKSLFENPSESIFQMESEKD